MAQGLPEILQNKSVNTTNYLIDFSFAGYPNGESKKPTTFGTVVNETDFGVIPNHGLDDS